MIIETKRWENKNIWGFFGKKNRLIKSKWDVSACTSMYENMQIFCMSYMLFYQIKLDIFIICSTSCGRASPHQGISRLDPYTTQDLLGKSLGMVKYSLRTEGILPIFGKKKRNEKCVNYIILMIEKMQLWQPTTHLSQQTCHWHLIILPCAGICQNRFSSVTFS